MRLEVHKDRQLAKRKGLVWRTVVGLVWLALVSVAAYYLTGWFIENQVVSLNFIYGNLLIPPTVKPETVRLGFTLVIVVAVQFFILVGYGLASPVGRQRPGKATAFSKDPDPLDKFYYR
jgi:hypothetical protein